MNTWTRRVTLGAFIVINLELRTQAAEKENTMTNALNLASIAEITVSGEQKEFPSVNAVDGNRSTEWASDDGHFQTNTPDPGVYATGRSMPKVLERPWIKLQWKTPVKVGRLVLCDRSDPKSNAQGGKVLFSDGTTIDVDDIPPDGKPCEVRFPPKIVTWLRLDLFTANGRNVGLAGFEVYSDGESPPPFLIAFPKPGTVVTILGNDMRIVAKEGRGMACPFSGTGVKLYGKRFSSGGMADIYIDGIFQSRTDFYSSTTIPEDLIVSVDGLADGKHWFGILPRPAKNPASQGTAVSWHRIEVVSGSHPDRFVPIKRTRFVPNVPLWLDDRGEPMQCHMGGIFHYEGKYYMLAMDWRGKRLPGFSYDWHKNKGVCVYSSPDLMNWTYHGNYFEPVSDPGHPLYDYTRIVVRPRLMRASGTGKLVALFYLVESTFQWKRMCAAVADKPEGPYVWSNILERDGRPLWGADANVFTDDDGTQYLVILDVLYQLAPDCLSAVKFKRMGTGGEAPAILKHDGIYYLLHSHLSGLGCNDNFYHTATNIWGPWSSKGNIAQGENSARTFMTQMMDVVPVAGKKGAFIWIGDSIRKTMDPYTRTVWLPVTIKENNEMEIRWRDSWDLAVFGNCSALTSVACSQPLP